MSKDVSLEIIEVGDLDLLLSWRNDERVYKWCRQRDLLTYEEHYSWFKSLESNKQIKMYLITGEDEKVGVCGLTSIDLYNQQAEFSLYISPEKHNEGYGLVALNLLLEHAFKTYPLNLIYGEVFEHNEAAFRLFEAIGFKYDGVRRDFYFKDGKFINAKLISIKRSEFLK